MITSSREYHLARRPVGMPTDADFRLVTTPLPPVGPGQVLVRNTFLSVDPYMRSRMSEVKSYAEAFQVGAVMTGGAIGRVEASEAPGLSVGDTVLSMFGWREGFVADAKYCTKVDVSAVPPQAYLGTLGMPGLTAYAGLLHVGGLQDGETVLVSGAAGAVGMVVCQIAKAKGCRVIGVVGSDSKGAWLTTHCKVDAIVNYKTVPSLRKAIAAAAPDGVDVVFENVGGEHLEAAAQVAKNFARIAICGLISQYNATELGDGFRNMREVLVKRLMLRGFIVTDFIKLQPEFLRDMMGWVRNGKVVWTETVVDGFERTLEAFYGLFHGTNTGKMVVRL